MPRRARLTLPNIPLHLIQRGNNRQACFFADEEIIGDRPRFNSNTLPSSQSGVSSKCPVAHVLPYPTFHFI